MEALINTFFKSGLLEIRSFVCQCRECGWSGIEYQDKMSICYVNKGSFLFNIFRNDLECFTGKFLINKPSFTHRVKHYHAQPDECLIINFAPAYYSHIVESYGSSLNRFLKNDDLHSLLIDSTIETEYLIYKLRGHLLHDNLGKLQIEVSIAELMDGLFNQGLPVKQPTIPDSHKRAYLPLIETAKEFIKANFAENITLDSIASIACMSPFHFNRIFRQITRISPYQYLLNFRICHAKHLLCTTVEPISTISYLSGFNSPDHFSYAFRMKEKVSPQTFRRHF